MPWAGVGSELVEKVKVGVVTARERVVFAYLAARVLV
jgi:hypothetical protein